MKVLIADDSTLILERLQQMLSAYKQVEIVGSLNNGKDALASLKTLKPDLAIVDNKMPGLTGIQVLSEIRKENATLKFMLLTFYSTDNYKQLAINAGADYFFSKVDDFEKISGVVQEMLLQNENDKKITIN